MKAIIPAAGQGTRLFPQTHTRPKPMVRLAGKPILGHILSSIAETDIDEVIVVVGLMRNQIVDYVESAFGTRFETTFVEQDVARGLGHAIYQAEPYARGDGVLIALGDMLFESGYNEFVERHREIPDADGSIGVKSVDEPSRYGIAEMDADGRVTDLVEKPADPPSDLAISGIYIIENTHALFDELAHLVDNDVRGAGDEYQLTDALARMVDGGATLRTFEIKDWYDCGRPETLLEANRVLLERDGETGSGDLADAVVVPPVDFGEDVTVDQSIVGPHVSLDTGATVTQSIVRNSIVGERANLNSVNLRASIVGSDARVKGRINELNVGDSSDVVL